MDAQFWRSLYKKNETRFLRKTGRRSSGLLRLLLCARGSFAPPLGCQRRGLRRHVDIEHARPENGQRRCPVKIGAGAARADPPSRLSARSAAGGLPEDAADPQPRQNGGVSSFSPTFSFNTPAATCTCRQSRKKIPSSVTQNAHDEDQVWSHKSTCARAVFARQCHLRPSFRRTGHVQAACNVAVGGSGAWRASNRLR
jgi:hypothetical protein